MSTPKGHVFVEYGCDCGETNPLQFYQTRKTQCKSCFNDSQKQKWKDNKARAIVLKGGQCSQCGYDKCAGALEFHHKNPLTKEDNWGRKWQLTWSKVEKALEGTTLLCANCHREEHHNLFITK